MQFQISRNGQMYGPYTLEDLQRYLASGNVLPTDLAKSEEMTDWLPVSQILAGGGAVAAALPVAETPTASGFASSGFTDVSSSGPATGFAAPAYAAPMAQPGMVGGSPYEAAPNLHWGLVLLFSFLTCGLFMFIWNLVIAAWLKRVQPNATSLYYYAGATVLLVVRVVVAIPHGIRTAMQPGMHATGMTGLLALLGIAIWVIRLIARYSQRASLEEHYNVVEPMGLRLDAVMTFFFGGLYFQSKLNDINAMKQAARYGAGIRPY